MSECVHCERPEVLDEVGLCSACRATEGIRVLYERRRGWSPEWEEHLRRLARRAKARLPLFDQEVHHAIVANGGADGAGGR